MPFQTLRKNFKTHIKNVFNSMKYGDNHRLPLVYLETYTSSSAHSYEFPKELPKESLKDYQEFPKLSQEILVTLFQNIGVHYVPEVALYELKEKTALKSFKDFCFTFGMDDTLVNSKKLNCVIERLRKMDDLRREEPFDSRPIYSALAYYDLNKADRLIDEMKKGK